MCLDERSRAEGTLYEDAGADDGDGYRAGQYRITRGAERGGAATRAALEGDRPYFGLWYQASVSDALTPLAANWSEVTKTASSPGPILRASVTRNS